MSPRAAALSLTACLALLPVPPVRGQSPGAPRAVRVDRHGDPLPRHALARLGTVRFRQPSAWCVAYSPDGRTLASGRSDCNVRLWDPATGKERGRLEGHRGAVNSIAFSADGALLVSGSYDRTLRLWDVAARKQLRVLRGHAQGIMGVAFSSDGKRLASGSMDNTVRCWDAATGRHVRLFDGVRRGNRVETVAFAPDGKLLAAGTTEGEVRLWTVPGWKERKALRGHQEGITALAFTPDGKRIVTVGFDKTVRTWDVATGKEVRRLDETEYVWSVALSRDGRMAAGDAKGTLVVWDTAGGRELARWKAGRDWVEGLAFSLDGKALASTALGSDIRLWDPATGKRLNPTSEPTGAVKHLAFSPDGGRLAVVTGGRMDESLHVWEVRTWKERVRIDDPQGRVSDIAFSPDGKLLASGQGMPAAYLAPMPASGPGMLGAVRLWEAATGRPRGRFPCRRYVYGIAFSPAGDRLFSADDRGLTSWDTATWKESSRLEVGPRLVGSVACAPDGRLASVPSVGSDGVVRLWDTTGRNLRPLVPRPPGTRLVRFSPDGKTLATLAPEPSPGGGNSEVRLYEAGTGAERGRFRVPEKYVLAVALSPDGRLLAASSGETIRLWEPASGREVRRLTGHSGGGVNALAFSPDGHLLVSGGEDSTVLVWDVPALAPPRPLPDGELAAARLKELWTDLAGADGARAYRAIAALADHPGQAAPFLRDALKQRPRIDGKRLNHLIADLDSEDFKAREKASEELAGLGQLAEPALRETLRGRPSLELARRVQRLLAKLDRKGPPPDRLRTLRALEALERMGTPAAREVLRTLTADSADPALARDAKAALQRLAGRP